MPVTCASRLSGWVRTSTCSELDTSGCDRRVLRNQLYYVGLQCLGGILNSSPYVTQVLPASGSDAALCFGFLR